MEAKMIITKDMTLQEIIEIPCFEKMQGNFVSTAMGDWMQDKKDMTLTALQEKNPTWFCEDILKGLNRLREIAESGMEYVCSLETGASLIHMPAKEKKYREYAILMAGGAYGAVCTMIEAMPVAAKLNELGIDCFCVNYRTASKKSFLKGLMPQPLDDLAAAWKYIKTHENEFGLEAEKYIAGGFSAGGHLCAMWGTAHKGARSYKIPNPKLLLLAYPLITTENLNGPIAAIIRTGMFGAASGKKKCREYSADLHIDENYPPVYFVCAKDDDTVPAKDSNDMEKALSVSKINRIIERVDQGGHGFGLGTACDANGWVERAVDFLKGI